MKIKHALAIFLVCSVMSAFAQEESEKIAVYVSGAKDAGVNKSFTSKLLFAILQTGKYAEIRDSEAFYAELSGSPSGAGRIAQTGKQHGADLICVVALTEAFGAYSISARLITTSDFQTVKTASFDRTLKSLDDLTSASNDLVRRLFDVIPEPVPEPAPQGLAPSSPVVEAPAKECADKFNINELVSKIQSGFPSQLKDCSVTLAKNMALAMSPFGKKTELKEPKAFMIECTIDGLKRKLPDGAADYIKPVESFVQNILNAASAAGGGLDVKKLSGAIGGMNVNALINELKAKAAGDECASDEPYEPPASDDDDEESEEDGRKIVSFGFRTGMNFSHLNADYHGYYGDESGTYSSILGFQAGLLLDVAPSSWFHLQHSVMYIQKGMEDDNVTSNYIELLPLSLSFKFAAFRLGAGPYFGFCVNAPSGNIDCGKIDIGFNAGLGFDIGMFYIGTFYEYGFVDVSNRSHFDFYNRTLGFNLGINL
jgi:hypothetical protein